MRLKRCPPALLAVSAVSILFTLSGSRSCAGATLLVYNNNDAGAGSLRQAIADNRALGGGNTVVFSNIVSGTITLVSGELVVTNNVTVQGAPRAARFSHWEV